MTRTTARRLLGLVAALGVAATTVLTVVSPAAAAEGRIDHVEQNGAQVSVLYSVLGANGATPDLKSLQVTLDGNPIDANAEFATDSKTSIRRTEIIMLDGSLSMAGAKFTEAKAAANAFLDAVPADVYVGLVDFSGTVTTAEAPTQDRAAVRQALDSIKLARGTALFDAVVQSTQVAGTEGSRTILLLSDGKDTTGKPITQATDAIKQSGVKVDAVSLSSAAADNKALTTIARAGDGSLLPSDPAQLTSIFQGEAQTLTQQVLITFQAPDITKVTEGTLAITMSVGGAPVSGSAFISVQPPTSPTPTPTPSVELKVAQLGTGIPKMVMFMGLGAAGVGLLILLLTAFGVFQRRPDALSQSIGAYSRERTKGHRAGAPVAPAGGEGTFASAAVGVAERALRQNKGIESGLGRRLDAAGVSFKPAEWLLLHAGITFGAGLVALLATGANFYLMVVGLAFGAAAPYFYLTFLHSRRLAAFGRNLANTLQLMSGSLSAGLSLAQSVDTVVREGTDPIAGEFRRALVEARLGVQLEDALEGVAARMKSRDFEWVVMAIRIQREVGGNLAELLNNVAGTIREREFLERQVKTLSAEGRLSVWVLGGLAPAFMLYLSFANPSYLSPMFTDPRGWIMLGVMAVMESVGVFWMSRLVKVKV